MPQIATKYNYDRLVSHFLKEAVQCLENKCYFAAIAMAWAAVDRAIDFELSGGVHNRKPIEFKPSAIKGKLEKLYLLYPQMKKVENLFNVLYHGFRNPFLHLQIERICIDEVEDKAQPLQIIQPNQEMRKVTAQPIRVISINTKYDSKLILKCRMGYDLTNSIGEPQKPDKIKVFLEMAPDMAKTGIKFAKTILDHLADSVENN